MVDAVAKENTILELSYAVLAELYTLRAKLDTICRRVVKVEEGKGEAPEAPPNVLDEIIANLDNARLNIRELQDYVATQVVKKIQ